MIYHKWRYSTGKKSCAGDVSVLTINKATSLEQRSRKLLVAEFRGGRLNGDCAHQNQL